VIAPLLDPRTRDKIIILGTDYKERLLQDIDAEQLPVQYGGTCTVPLHDSSTERAVRALVQSNLPAAGTATTTAITTDTTSTATATAGSAADVSTSGAESSINSSVGADSAVNINSTADSNTAAAAATAGKATTAGLDKLAAVSV
jgi:CRAL/TRIO domain